MTETPYSPRLRTGVLLCGSGTAGAYQAGALRAILEAGIKIDVIAAHGAGVLTALAAFLFGAFTIAKTLLWGDPVPGYPTLAAIIVFLGGVRRVDVRR